MAYAKCYDCGWEQDHIPDLEKAQALATLHYRLSKRGCLMSFGYANKYEAIGVNTN